MISEVFMLVRMMMVLVLASTCETIGHQNPKRHHQVERCFNICNRLYIAFID
jgi:hypothetical protein